MKIKKHAKPPIHCKHDRLSTADDLRPNPRNPNTHSPEQIRALSAVIRANGWRRPVVVSKLSGLVVCGHGAVQAAKLLNCQVPVNDQDFASEAEEHAHMIADNRLQELSEIDKGKLAELIRELEKSIEIEGMGFDENSVKALLEELSDQTTIRSLEVKAPPKLAWVLIGIPLVRFGEISHQVEALAQVSGIICEQTVTDDAKENGQP